MKDKSESVELNNSAEVDYTPYIVAPSSTDQDVIYYNAHVEPALLAALKPLDIEFFFTLTILHVPTLDEGVLVSPLIVIFSTNEPNFNIIRSKIEPRGTRQDLHR